MTSDRELMQQALKYTKPGAIVPVTPETVKILVDALRLAIEQAERQEPVAGEYATCLEDGERVLIASVLPVGYGGNKTRTVRVVWPDGMDGVYTMFQFARLFSPVGERTTPPRREWQGLTDGDKLTIRRRPWETPEDLIDIVEDVLKEKNT